ncbi:ORF6N domain-containing protein [Xiamenia xianingshaonis]|uniref:ORF6N domain-containing protein n=1 Tax=Xiamenia xianingshaonis TaxID=2682776 RepID=A0A9E6SU35_9ACTN|nr:ORF6N domain-containing protein [Xiamenia xianingshaonis]NHM14957.1 ORF6N domain-containing protein [Xiamenia xianingshaonis]QTU84024.1 ORF6N domain-containing protein [Xiamenia xianingshaonis]
MAKQEKNPSAELMETEENTAVAIVPANEPAIRDLIYTVRGVQVMLDSDLAKLYQVETGALNRAAKRNEDRFPEDFRFRLTREECDNLKCQIGILAGQDYEMKIGRTYMPFVYTEQGVAMLSGVLRSDIAVQTSVRIMRAFVEMRHFIASNAAMFEQVRGVELKLLEYQKTTDERFERVFDYMDTHEAPKQKVFFDGQVWDAFELLVSLVQRAKREIVLIDGYVDTGTLSILAKKQGGVDVVVWTHPHTRLDQHDVDTFNVQYPQLEIRHTTAFHDRFLILDGVEGYFVGASFKDAGKKSFAIARIEGEELVGAILSRLERP